MNRIRKANGIVKKGVSMLLAGFLVLGQFPIGSVQAADSGTTNTYDSVVTKAGNYAMKQLGESFRSNAANAQVVTTVPVVSAGKIYYVAPDGNDGNTGTSPEAPWQTVQKVNATIFAPGDMILFKAGCSWELTEPLYPKGSGTEGNRIVIGAYGTGAKPKFSAKNIAVPWTFTDGSTRYASDVLYLENQEYIEIRDLDISNKPDDYTGQQADTQAAMRKDRRGIHIVGGNNTTQTELNGFWLHDLYVHDVAGEANGVSATGWDPSKRTAGILFEVIVKGSNGLPVIANPVDVTGYEPTWFADVTIEKNVLIDNSFGGIIVKQLQAWGARQDASPPSYDYTGWYPNTRFTIENNYLDHDGSEYAADTIYLTCTNDSVIRHNVSRGAGTSAIELYFTDRITVEWNEVYRARQKVTGADSNAIDPDKASTNALIQYNYLHENGDGILLCGFIYGSAVVRYNVIKDSDNAKRYLNIHGDKGYNYIYNNIFYNSGSGTPTFVSSSGGGTYLNDSNNFHYLNNNIFYSPNNASARIDDGTGLFYSNNNYYNVAAVPSEDTSAIVADPKFKNPAAITGGIGSDVDLNGLQLQDTSPLISVGQAVTAHSNTTVAAGTVTDAAGNPISAAGLDVGVYEFVGADASVGGLQGYTYDPYGDIKAGVTVTVQAGGQIYTAISDSKGFYTISGIPAGAAVTATASLVNYASSSTASAQIFASDVSALNLTLGASSLTYGAIAGNIAGIPGATVTVTDSSGQTLGSAVTASDGSYTINNVPVGSGYTVKVTKTDYYDGTQNSVAVQAAHTTAVNITISRVVKALHYFLEENFDYDVGAFTGNDIWGVDSTGGTVEIVKDDNGNKYLKLAKTANANGIKVWNKAPMNAAGVFTIESRVKRTVAPSGANQFAIYSGETISSGSISAPMADFGFSGTNIFTHATRGSSTTSTISSYSLNKWYDIKMVVNIDTDTFDIYVDGVLKKTGAQLRTAGNAIHYFQIFASANNLGDFLVDYLWVYEGSPEGDDADVTSVTVDELGGSALSYDTGTQTFTSSSQVSYQNDSAKIRVAPSSPFAEVLINGTDLGRIDDHDYVTVPLSAGENNVSFTITAADGTAKTYTIKLNRQDPSLVAFLTALQITGLTLTPEFTGLEPQESELTFTAGTTSEIQHTLTYAKATLGSTVAVSHNGQTLASGSPVSLTLAEGPNTIQIVVSSESGDMFETYTIIVNVPLSVTVPAVPGNLHAAAQSAGAIGLGWDAVSNADSYNVYRSDAVNGTYVKLNTAALSGTTYTDNGLTASTTYYYKVTAVNTAGESGLSSVVSAKTNDAAPPVHTTAYTLSGPSSVGTGETFQLIYGLANVTGTVYAESVTVNYDPYAMAYVSAAPFANGLSVVGSTYGTGWVRILTASTLHPITGSTNLLTLTFRSLNESVTSNVYASGIVLGDQYGNEQTVGTGTSYSVNIAAPVPADKTALSSALASAASAVANAKVLNPSAPRYGYYPQSAIDSLNAAIATANAVLSQSSASQSQVDAAAAAVTQAWAQFLSAASQSAGVGDLAILAANYNATSSQANWQLLSLYDLNNDGKLDLVDLVAMAKHVLN